MKYRQLGKTDVKIPEIGFGTWAYTGGDRPLRRAIELGATLIDTAESYNTEQAVGQAIKGIREQVFLATKVSPHHFKRAALIKAADESLKRLKVECIDLYQLHWPNPDVPIHETMEAMEYLITVGKIRFIGVSNFSVAQLRTAQEATSLPIVSNQVEYSLIARCIESELLPYCQANGVTVIAYSPFSEYLNNILGRDKEGTINNVASTIGRTHAQVVLNWILRENNVVAIPKSNSVAHVEEDCLASGWKMPSNSLALLEEAFPVGYWGIYSRK